MSFIGPLGVGLTQNIVDVIFQRNDRKCGDCGCPYTMRRTLGFIIRHYQYSCPGRLGLPTMGHRGCQWTEDVPI